MLYAVLNSDGLAVDFLTEAGSKPTFRNRVVLPLVESKPTDLSAGDELVVSGFVIMADRVERVWGLVAKESKSFKNATREAMLRQQLREHLFSWGTTDKDLALQRVVQLLTL